MVGVIVLARMHMSPSKVRVFAAPADAPRACIFIICCVVEQQARITYHIDAGERLLMSEGHHLADRTARFTAPEPKPKFFRERCRAKDG